MLVSTKSLLKCAQKQGYALGAFNTCNLEITKAIFYSAEKLKSPVIIQTSEGELTHGGFEKLAGLIKLFAKTSKVPVAFHLDHAKSFDFIKKYAGLGFTSVMFDGSRFPYQKNLSLTKKVVAFLHRKNITCEGELGLVPTPTSTKRTKRKRILMTDSDQAEEFVKETKVDFLAIGIGNVHGAYKGKPKLDFKRLKKIKEKVKVPLVLHGGSFISAADIRKAISLGICKININTELRLAYAAALRRVLRSKEYVPYKLMQPVERALQQVVTEKIKVFRSFKKA